MPDCLADEQADGTTDTQIMEDKDDDVNDESLVIFIAFAYD